MNARWIVCVAIAMTCASQANAQPRTYGSPTGFGNILFPGTGHPPPLDYGAPSFPQRLAGTIQGRVNLAGPAGARGRTVVVPYAVPVFVGGYYGPPLAPPEPPMTIVQQPAAPLQAAPAPVVINQYFGGAGGSGDPGPMTVYQAPPVQPPQEEPVKPAAWKAADDKPTIYLVAFKSGPIYPTLAFWMEGDTLHYVSMDKTINKASIELIDRELSMRLNKERGVGFDLPAAK